MAVFVPKAGSGGPLSQESLAKKVGVVGWARYIALLDGSTGVAACYMGNVGSIIGVAGGDPHHFMPASLTGPTVSFAMSAVGGVVTVKVPKVFGRRIKYVHDEEQHDDSVLVHSRPWFATGLPADGSQRGIPRPTS